MGNGSWRSSFADLYRFSETGPGSNTDPFTFPFAEALPGKSIHIEITPLRFASAEMASGKALIPTRVVVRMEVVG